MITTHIPSFKEGYGHDLTALEKDDGVILSETPDHWNDRFIQLSIGPAVVLVRFKDLERAVRALSAG